MYNQMFSSAPVWILVITVCLANSGCRGGFRGIASCDSPSCGCAEEACECPSCGCAEEACECPSCGCAEEACEFPSCGCAEEACEFPSCGCAEEACECPSCGCAEEACDTVGCGNRVECGKDQCGWLKKLFGCFKLCGCAGCDGELYWSEWHNDPPGCEPCDSCGNWIGPRGVYRAPYRTPPGQITEPYGAQLAEPTTPYPVLEEENVPDELPEEGYPAESHLNKSPDAPRDDITFQEGQVVEESFELVLERETFYR